MKRGSLIDKPAQVERDESAPDWAKGYKLEDLRRVTTLFNRHDKGLLHGPFDRYRDRDAANDLRNDWLKLGPRDDKGVPVWACVVRELDRKQSVRDFTGERITLSPGTVYCTRMAFADENAAGSILVQLPAHNGPIAVECWQEHPGERALVSRLQATNATGQPTGGMRLAVVKIKESSAIRGLWVSHDIPYPPWASRAGEHYAPYPKQELLGLAQLPVELPQNAIRALSSHPVVRDESASDAHHASYATDDTWTALALRGFYDEPERVEKPSKMDHRWKKERVHDLDRRPRDTPLRAALGAAVEEILVALPCAGFERICLVRLAPGGELARHTDIIDPDAGASEGKVVRVHLPLISNERFVFQSWGLDGKTTSMVMRPGTAAYLDVRKPHTRVNTGDTPSVHLVADCYANAATVEMLCNATPAPLDGTAEKL
jgi:Aspartyl/Asparaginyl beta-hydroxylase